MQGRGIRIRSNRDVWLFVCAVTLLSVTLSETCVFLLLAMGGDEAFHFENALFFAALVPVLVAVPITWAVSQMSLALERTQVELRVLADTDPLTRLPNRRSFFQAAAIALADANETQTTSALLVIDADHFKELNDSYGHSAGDIALVGIADILRESFRRTDLTCRVGGEEFAVLLPDMDRHQARVIAERVVDKVASSPLTHANAIIEYSISCGIADSSTSYDLQTLFKAADDAMYMAKRSGRNRVALIDFAA